VFRSKIYNNKTATLNISAETEEDQLFKIFLWPPVEDKFEDIEKDLRMRNDIRHSETIHFRNKDELSSFIMDVYSTDDVDQWKVKKKISELVKYDNKVRYIVAKVENSKFRKKSKTGSPISQWAEKEKEVIRSQYKDCVDGYFKDIVIHISDNFEQNIKLSDIVEEYR
jgi:hypothetical protein